MRNRCEWWTGWGCLDDCRPTCSVSVGMGTDMNHRVPTQGLTMTSRKQMCRSNSVFFFLIPHHQAAQFLHSL